VRYWRGLVGFTTVWATQATPPHSIDKTERDVTHQENHSSENRSIAVDDEDEVVNVDHLARRPPGQY
jgi:hypothetical protein